MKLFKRKECVECEKRYAKDKALAKSRTDIIVITPEGSKSYYCYEGYLPTLPGNQIIAKQIPQKKIDDAFIKMWEKAGLEDDAKIIRGGK